jgi:hypothetical protein
LGADSFLMKGEQVPPGEYWGGNPAQPSERFPGLQDAGVPSAGAPAVEPAADRTDSGAGGSGPRVDAAVGETSESWVRLAAEFARLDALVAGLDAGSNLDPPEGDGATWHHGLPRQSTGRPEPEG